MSYYIFRDGTLKEISPIWAKTLLRFNRVYVWANTLTITILRSYKDDRKLRDSKIWGI
jgi:hypothetical protein